MSLESVDPTTGEVFERYEAMSQRQAAEVVDAVAKAQAHSSRNDSFAKRASWLERSARVLRDQQDDLAKLMAREMGKPFAQGKSEVEKCAWVCEHYAKHGEADLSDQMLGADYTKSYVAFRPLGVVLAVMPWNFPFWQVFRFAAPALMAGNAGVLKHSSNVTGCALAIENVFREANVPDHLFRTLRIGSDKVESVIAHPKIAAVTLTGSTPAGKAVASAAGQQLKKTVLELGGSDPYVVLEDADLGPTIESCATSRLLNSGQSCIAAKRFIVVEAIFEQFCEQFVEALKKRKVGAPLDEGVDVGPQARTDLRDELHQQVQKSVSQGAKLLLGGQKPEGPGAFYPITALTQVTPGMPAYDEELFGPVAAILRARDEADAIRIANDTSFGLGAAVFTKDVARGERIARDELDAGCCFVNDFVKSDPRLPFGGIKESGYGRELSAFGIREFVNIKTVAIK